MKTHFDAVVIGAGAAGLAAAVELDAAGLRLVCLEARDRIGGRIYTVRDPFSPVPIELGAEFIHGRAPEVLELASSGGLLVCDVGGRFLTQRGGRWTEGEEADGEIFAAVEDYRGPDQSWTRFITDFSASNAAKQFATRYVQGFNAARADEISLLSIQRDQRASQELGEHAQFRIFSGYDRIPQTLAARLTAPHATIRLNQVVENIAWERGHVSIGVRGRPEPIRAGAAVITLPVGVLQSGAVQFSPEPVSALKAAHNIAVGQVFRVPLRFTHAFWEEIGPLRDVGFLFTEEPLFPTWWTDASVRAPVITAWSAGPSADLLIGRPAAAVAQEAFAALARITGVSLSKVHESNCAWHVHDWHADPFACGAYTYDLVDRIDARRELARPVEDTLYFAGEAAEIEGHSATVHGAIRSGRRAARRLIESIAEYDK